MDDDSRVVPLPGSRRPAPAVRRLSQPKSRDEVKAELDELLSGDPDSDESPDGEWLLNSTASGLQSPPLDHRHAIICPQCEQSTWRYTEQCVHCGFNLFQYAEQRRLDEDRRRRAVKREQILRWIIGLNVAGLIPFGLLAWLPKIWLVLLALACFFVAHLLSKSLPEDP